MSVIEFDYMYKDDVMSHVKVDYSTKTVNVVNYTDRILFTPFGVMEK